MPLMAKMFALNMQYNYTRDVFAKPELVGGELLSICCITKTMMGWHLEKTASICRERCGGQGYLAANKFMDHIALAHAGITAEGDNRILMTKIVKDMITMHVKQKKPLPAQKYNPKTQLGTFPDVTQPDVLHDLFVFRQRTLLAGLLKKQKDYAKAGKSSYEILLRLTSDNMQELAYSYGQRLTMQACINNINKIQNPEAKQLMTSVFRLYGISEIKDDLGFYMMHGGISPAASANMHNTYLKLVREVAQNVDSLIECMNIAKGGQ